MGGSRVGIKSCWTGIQSFDVTFGLMPDLEHPKDL